MARQAQFRRGAVILDLNAGPYKVQAPGWTSSGAALEVVVIVQAASMAELDRYVGALHRWVAQAQVTNQRWLGAQVQFWTKTCDGVAPVAELGATWLVKPVFGGSVMMEDPATQAEGHYAMKVIVSLAVGEQWRRATPESSLEAISSVTIREDGGITSNGLALTGRRLAFSASTGLTVRYRWLATPGASCDFMKWPGTTVKAWWDGATSRFKMQDASGTPYAAQSSQQVFAAGQEVDVVFRWAQSSKMAIWVNGTADGVSGGCALSPAPESYTLFEPTGAQTLLGAQVWPAALMDAECAGLFAQGRPEPELVVVLAPPNDKNMNGWHRLYNWPGSAPGQLRLVFDGSGQDYDQVWLGLRPLRVARQVAWECEAEIMGLDTAGGNGVTDANAANGLVARFTPSNTDWGTRVTVVLAADPDDVAGIEGEHRLLLACRDQAPTVNINQVRWRLVVAGQAEGWSDPAAPVAVSTYSLLDLGAVRMPPGQWPPESIKATTDVHAGNYVTLELQVRNTTGSGGGAFDLDALYLQPAEAEGVLRLDLQAAKFGVADWTGERPSVIGVADFRSMEFYAWGSYDSDPPVVVPNAGEAGTLTVKFLRDGAEQAWMNDLCDVLVLCEPRWM